MDQRARTSTTFAPPVMEARRWLDGVTFTKDRPLINVSQAAPVDPVAVVLGHQLLGLAVDANQEIASRIESDEALGEPLIELVALLSGKAAHGGDVTQRSRR